MAVIEAGGHAVDTFGWPGAVFFVGVAFVVTYASPEQKREIIDVYLLMKGPLGFVGVIIAMGVLGSVVLLGQKRVHEGRERVLRAELARLAKEKTEYQNKSIEDPLHTSKQG